MSQSEWNIIVYVKAFIINVNKCLKPFFLEQHIDIVNRVKLLVDQYIQQFRRCIYKKISDLTFDLGSRSHKCVT